MSIDAARGNEESPAMAVPASPMQAARNGQQRVFDLGSPEGRYMNGLGKALCRHLAECMHRLPTPQRGLCAGHRPLSVKRSVALTS